MRVAKITAPKFAGLEGKSLDLLSGFNLVHGANESGKTTWHNAIYALICGIRHKGGGASKKKQEFHKKYYPWHDTGSWEVFGTIFNDRGQEFRVRQDLANSTGSGVSLQGKDVRADYEYEGNPDLSSLVGLQRETFASIAVIRQADILAIASGDNLGLVAAAQSAVGTGGRGGTAATALEILRNYKSEHVGLDRANSIKPLRQANEAIERATRNLFRARNELTEFTSKLEEAQGTLKSAEAVSEEIRQLGLELKAVELRGIRSRIARATEEESFLRSVDLSQGSVNSDLIASVNDLIARSSNQLTPPQTPKKSSAELEAESSALVEPTRSDEAKLLNIKNASLVQAVQDYEATLAKVSTIATEISDLESLIPLEQPESLDSISTLSADTVEKSGHRKRIIIGLVCVALGSLGMFMSLIAGLVGIGVGAAFLLSGPLIGTKKSTTENHAAPHKSQVGQTEVLRSRIEAKQAQHLQVLEDLGDAFQELSSEFERYGLKPVGGKYRNLISDIYFQQELEKYRKTNLEYAEAISNAKAIEIEIQRIQAMNSDLYTEMISRAVSCGLRFSEGAEQAEMRAAFKSWLVRQSEILALDSDLASARARLAAILDGKTISELEEEASKIELLQGEPLPSISEHRTESEVRTDIASLRIKEVELREAYGVTTGELENMRKSSLSVGECELELAHAQRELDSVKELDYAINCAITHLEDAEIDVNNDVAPIIQDKIMKYLPRLTSQRYLDVVVDSQNLSISVQIPNGSLKDATNLSYGTAEQIYLLLRLALVDHLTSGTESCPIICDDITVHADSARKIEMLNLLLELSKVQQIVLFSQEAEVLAWAKENLLGEFDQIVQIS